MDYNDNDYEGQNLHLGGEESSKISSVLRPFALPKFDFDDSLHGHLRFDSLVENEVFLGIPSQEDNQWIEDFSRAGNCIEFSSSATESCALPRHINVWSEATSSESVEMLLKAVGQEEMVPGENMIKESDPDHQVGSSTRQMEDDKLDDVDYENPSLPAAGVEGNFSRSNQNAGAAGVHSEHTLQGHEINASFCGECVDSKDSGLIVTTENSNIDTKRTNDNQGGTCGLVSESLPNQVEDKLPNLGIKIDSAESSSQKIAVSVGESVNQDKISDFSFVSSGCIAKGVSDSIEEQGGMFNKNDESESRVAVESDSMERHCSSEISSKKSPEKGPGVEICITKFGEASGTAKKGESVSRDDGCKEVASGELLGGSQQGTVVSSSNTEIKQLSEGHNILHEKSSTPLHGEGIERLGLKDIVTPTIGGSTEVKQAPVIQHESLVGNEDICPEGNSSVEVPQVTFESVTLHEVPANPTEKDGESTINHADVTGDATGSTFTGESFGEKSVIDDMRDTRDTVVIQTENVEDADRVPSSLTARGIEACTEEDIPAQADDHEGGLDGSAYEKEDNKPLDPSDMVFDDTEKEVGATFSGDGVKVEATTQSQPKSSPGDNPVLNTEEEHTKLKSSRVEGDELVDRPQLSCDTGIRDQTRETESEAPKQLSTSVSKESLVSNELASAIETEKGMLLDSVAGDMKTSDQSVPLAETSSVGIPGEAFKEVNKMLEHSDNDLMVKDDGAKAAPTEKPMEEDTERNNGTNSSMVSVTSCTVETDKSNQAPEAGGGSTDLSESEINKEASLTMKNVENIGEVLATSKISGVDVRPTEEGTFTFDIRPLGGQSSEDSGKVLQSFPRIQACKLSLAGDRSPSTSGSSQTDVVVVKEISNVSSLIPAVNPPSGDIGGASERKARRGSIKSGKGSARKGNHLKETTSLRQTDKGDKSSQFLSPLRAGQHMTFDTAVKPRGGISIATSSLPDLNTSAPSSAFFQQPFTDLQQVQLRAQIFVYGSLIQGAAPDEACMVSAFDGGRGVWEPSWRACVERLHGQKSHGNNSETPVPSRSGAKVPDQTNRQGFPQSEVLSSMAGRASSKAIPSSMVTPMIPLSSPLWTMSTPSGEVLPPSSMARSSVFDYQAASPLNPYQTPPIRNYMAHTTWPSQAPFAVPWLAPSQSSPFDMGTNYPAFPITEPVKLTPVKESSLPITSSTKHLSPTLTTHTGTSMFAGTSSLDLKKAKVSTGQTVDTKARKRKKSSGAEDVVQISVTASLADTVSAPVVANQLSKKAPAVGDLSQISLVARNQTESMLTPVVSSHYSTSVAVAASSSFVPKGTTSQFISMVSPSVSTDQLKRGDFNMDKRALNIEGFSKVEEAKLQAQEAAAHAAAAISHCEGVWGQLNQQNNSGLTPDAESKLASAAAAIAAAACVAKAAAAAAKIASTAAVQAKQMADEAVAVSDSTNNLANASPVSFFKGGDRNNVPSLAISAAREAARKRIEAASAATRHAENLDAIVKAAELAAEAVSHAGKIVAMGDPFSLSEIAEAGPNNYWRVSQVPTEPGSKPNDMNKNKSISSNAGEVPSVYMNEHEGLNKNMNITSHVLSSVQGEVSRDMVDDHATVEESLIASVKHGENSFKPQKDKKPSDSAKTTGVVPDPNVESRLNLFTTTSIKEGTRVEVLKDRGDLKAAWFSASVLSLKDGEALVCYTELQSDEGSEVLKEWVPLEAKDGEAPKVRIPHPMTAVQFEGTRKRRRAAVKDYTWSVGDKVDAWLQDCWCEGIITEKQKKDATSLSVHFPAQGKTLMVKVWHLRPTLIWSDGQWTEWCRPGQDGTSQGDTPAEKRPKVGATSFETKGKEKMAKNIDFVEIGRSEEPRLPLSANEKVFNIGSAREENKPNTVRAMRSALEKEGSRVVFGVPKPGKKRKFMEVSKHYVSDGSSKTNVPNDSVKLAKYLVPQGSGSRGFKNNSKLDLKEKQVAETKPRALKSGKPPSIPSRTLGRKDDSTSSRSNVREAVISDHSVKGSTSNDENESSEQNPVEFGSVSNVEETSGGNMVFTSQALPQENRKKAATRKTKSERVNQGKLAPASGKPAKSEVNEKLISEVAEPRRSNRRIQPTSRLLEGLQSSLIISKIPSSSHDKSYRSHNKGTARGNNNRG
ncbi:hypothetical protein CDL12_06727 [Handroanthus impetiginosus]|uniref:Agenet domain-containing protein n=1 Tax=Handroanthus impetiginosus TaxID=429701 RepID=A0A2G9HST8_9LAMI|nr:hypothetical protein CDL12_06727 [Handroanthus impetiginosus]